MVPAQVVRIDPKAPFPDRLSELHLFENNRKQTPSEGLIPYDLNTPHFADYANLHRFLRVPPGKKVLLSDSGELEYPEGTALILTVGYLHDMRDPTQGEDLVETRLLVLGEEGWQSAQYIWNDGATDATLTLVGEDRQIEWIHSDGSHRSLNYHVPNVNQCKMCHEYNDEFLPLGPLDSRNLNRPIEVEAGTKNQLEYWAELGILAGLPTEPNLLAAFPVWDDPSTGTLNERARAYLEVNCGSCHRPDGLAYTSGLDLTYDQTEPVRFGVYKSPVAAGRGVGKARFGIVPGSPEGSILFHRMDSTDPGVRMPVVGRSLIHEEGVSLIAEWISSMQERPKG